ncbi:T9SS type A sorting domain-containing protein [Foetidibacter luteolus]|uniref:T9SS type A sorting domain-containing protein n=1 Tax=Foetidibacter luteolus TaxID=2608880 RepID=UPI00129ACD31|nr:T9SS type A sorting domain-containing protein [Foetidibacter luteolus]
MKFIYPFIKQKSNPLLISFFILVQLLAVMLLPLAGHATNYTVNSTSDANTGSGTSGTLRYCITQANANTSAPHTINFGISGTGVKTITLNSALPIITRQMTINGYSQTGALQGPIASRTLTIQLIGSPASPIADFFDIQASNTEICGLAFATTDSSGGIGSYAPQGTTVSGVKIWGNYFNTDATGNTTTGSGYIISAFGKISGSVSNLQGWVIGTDGNGINDANEGNLFAHATQASTYGTVEPLRIFFCDNFIIAGNTIGLRKDGVTPLQTFTTSGQQNYGIALVNCTGFRIGTDGNGVSDALERNIIAGMRRYAIVIFANQQGGNYYNNTGVNVYYPIGTNYDVNRLAGNNVIYGNYIGTDITGTGTGANLANGGGILLSGTTSNTIGSSTNASQRNIIVNTRENAGTGINISGEKFNGNPVATSKNNLVTGNYIGLLADGITASGNNTGILLYSGGTLSATDTSVYKNTISKNIIANSTSGGGINLFPTGSRGLVFDNTFTQNTIYNNYLLGINLGSSNSDWFVTPNDGALSTPSASNANRLADYGILTVDSLAGNTLYLEGYVGNNSAGNALFANATIEFFTSNNSPADQSGQVISGDGLNSAHGEGQTYLGTLTANANGLFSGTIDVTGKGLVKGSSYITNTATTNTGSTSEFSANILLVTIQGTVYNDEDGLTDSRVDGNVYSGSGLKAVLFNTNSSQVTAVADVGADGAYLFNTGVVQGASYAVFVTTATATVGALIPPLMLPSNFASVGEFLGTGNGSDGSADGYLPLGLVTGNLINANFGIEELPTAGSGTVTVGNPNGVNQVVIPPNAFSNTAASTDVAPGIVTSIRITAIPTGASSIKIGFTTYGPGYVSFPAGGVTVAADETGRPTEIISVDPTADGPTTVTIPFKAVDNAGKESSNTGAVTVTLVDNNCGSIQGSTNKLVLLTATGTITDLKAGDKLLKENAIFTNNAWYDAVITITAENVPTGSLIVDNSVNGNGNLSLSGIRPDENPYVVYNIKFVQSGSATSSNPDGTPVTLSNISLTIPDIDGTGSSSYVDVAGYATSFAPSSVQLGSSLQNSGFVSGGPGSGYTYYRPKTIPAASVPSTDPAYRLAAVKSSYSNADFVFGVTAGATVNSNANRLFFHSFQQACSQISGNVFNDTSGLANSTVDGSPVNGNDIDASIPGSQPLYASLVQSGVITSTVQVTAPGTYSFVNIPNGTYSIVLHQSSGGSTTPSLPVNWGNTGEKNGTGTGSDGTADGILSATLAGTNVTDANFGIDRFPEATSFTYEISPVPTRGGTYPMDGSYRNMFPLDGNDPEEGSLGQGATFVITGFNYMNGNQLSYNGVQINGPLTIANYNPALLTVTFNQNGNSGFSFNYAVKDWAGLKSPEVTYTVWWGSAVLAVKHIDLSAQQIGSRALLTWAATGETSNEIFTVEKSADAFNWAAAGTVKTHAGNGNNSYNFTDNTPLAGSNFYRIRHTGANGVSIYSQTRHLRFTGAWQVSVTPNVTAGQTLVKVYSNQPLKAIRVINAAGQTCISKTLLPGSQIHECNISTLPNGIYMVQLINSGKDNRMLKLLKN